MIPWPRHYQAFASGSTLNALIFCYGKHSSIKEKCFALRTFLVEELRKISKTFWRTLWRQPSIPSSDVTFLQGGAGVPSAVLMSYMALLPTGQTGLYLILFIICSTQMGAQMVTVPIKISYKYHCSYFTCSGMQVAPPLRRLEAKPRFSPQTNLNTPGLVVCAYEPS